VAELCAGARPKEFDSLKNLFHALTCVSADAEIGRQAGEYLLRYRKSHGVELGDAIQSQALSHEGTRIFLTPLKTPFTTP
jgi:hypothetical protein